MTRTNIIQLSRLKTIYFVSAIAVFLVLNGNSVFAQGGGQIDISDFTDTGTTSDSGSTVSDNSDTVDFSESAELDLGGLEEDNRNQGFVGATAAGMAENNFVGSASQTFGALAEDATFGGGVNDATSHSVPSPAAAGAGGQGGFNATTTAGVIVLRQSIRAHLKPAFSSPTVNPSYTAHQFVSNLSRQSGTENFQGRYQVLIDNKTATLIGSVQTQADADRIVRQLRLQPGVYRIDNQLTVQQ